MELRKVILVGHSLGVTLPKKFLKLIGTGGGQYLELFMADKDTIVVRKHKLNDRKKV